MSTLAFSDLDRTLIHSAAASGLDAAGLAREAEAIEHLDGRVVSYLGRRADAALRDLVAARALVPVTTRTVAQTLRVRGPFPAAELIVCANGGRLLRHGVEDRGFGRAVDEALAGAGAPLAEVEPLLRARPESWRSADGLFAYAVRPDRDAAERARPAIEALLRPLAWSASVQGRKLYAVPDALSKRAAAVRLADELGAERSVAAGDSLLDADLLRGADAAIRPAHGELHETDLHLPHLTVTASSGLAAGTEIALWLRAQVLGER